MASSRRRISKAERQERDALMRVINWVHVIVIRRLFDDGLSTSDVAMLYPSMQREAGRIAIAHAMPDWHYVDETQVADLVYASMISEHQKQKKEA
jgi:hypothetical protein